MFQHLQVTSPGCRLKRPRTSSAVSHRGVVGVAALPLFPKTEQEFPQVKGGGKTNWWNMIQVARVHPFQAAAPAAGCAAPPPRRRQTGGRLWLRVTRRKWREKRTRSLVRPSYFHYTQWLPSLPATSCSIRFRDPHTHTNTHKHALRGCRTFGGGAAWSHAGCRLEDGFVNIMRKHCQHICKRLSRYRREPG